MGFSHPGNIQGHKKCGPGKARVPSKPSTRVAQSTHRRERALRKGGENMIFILRCLVCEHVINWNTLFRKIKSKVSPATAL